MNKVLTRACAAAIICGALSAQVYITTGQTGSNGKIPANWTFTPNTPYQLAGGNFTMGVTTGHDYSLNVRANNASGSILTSITLTNSQLCATESCTGSFNPHVFQLSQPYTFLSGNTYYVELVSKNSTTNVADSNLDGLKNPTSFYWIDGSGNTVDVNTCTTPAGPTSVTATRGNGTITLSFTEPSASCGLSILRYRGQATPAGGGTIIEGVCTAPTTSCAITGLTNGVSYNVAVEAENVMGPGTAVTASNSPLTPASGPTSFTLTGPAGGGINAASGVFTITPDAAYTGTVTITPGGGGLSSAQVFTFSSSATPQTFTITPSSAGPVTLTPSNNGGLTNPSTLSYKTNPSAPTIGTATAGNASVSVAFSTPSLNGGSSITSYTATCGSRSATGSSSPLSVTGLTNGTAYTCTVKATNLYGDSAASAASNSVTPVAPATSFTLTGPSGGAAGVASGTFTVTPNSTYNGTVTITPSGGGLSTPVVLTFSNSATAQTFTISPSSARPVILTPSNSGSLTNPSALSYKTNPTAPTIGTATAGNASISVAFTAPVTDGGGAITGYTATCGSIFGTGSGSPISVTGLTNGTPYTCTVTATNAFGDSAASSSSNSATPLLPATSFTLAGPASGLIGLASTAFTVTPNAFYTGTVTLTPSGGGLTVPVVLTFDHSSTAQTFTITPSTAGPVSITPSNNGSLTNPSAVTYQTNAAAPTIGAVSAGNGSASVTFAAPAADGGSGITSYTATCGSASATGSGSPIQVTGLINGTPYTCTAKATNAVGESAVSAASNSVTPGSPATTFTFTGPDGGSVGVASGAFTVTPNAAYTGTVTITPSGVGLSAPVVLTFSNSAAPQTFTIAPVAVGPGTLTATNTGGLTNPAPVSYKTNPTAPAIGTASAGNASVLVAFTAPLANGGSAVTEYTAACGSASATGAASPIQVTGLANGTAYTCTVRASNAVGMSDASAASNSVTPTAGTLSTSPASAVVGVDGGTYTFSMSGPSARSWTAVSQMPWLQIANPASGFGNGSVTYTALPNKTGAARTGQITIEEVTFPITQRGPGSVSPSSIAVTSVVGTGAVTRIISVSTASPGEPWVATVTPPATWLQISTTEGVTPAQITVTLQPGTLAPGSYSTTITVTGLTIPVTYTVTAPTVTLTQDSLYFQQLASGEPIRPQVLAMSTNGTTLDYAATVASPGASWLSVTRPTGTIPGSIEVSATSNGLSAGEYSTSLRIAISGAQSQTISVPVTLRVPVLNVQPIDKPSLAAQQVQVDIGAGQVRIAHTNGTTSPNQQVPLMVSSTEHQQSFQAAATMIDGASWLRVSPASGTTPAEVHMDTSAGQLAPGTYRGYITIRSTGMSPDALSPRARAVARSAVSVPGDASTSTIAVTLTVGASASLLASPASVNFTSGGPSSAAVSLTGSDGAAFYTATDSAWLRVTSSAGTVPASLTLQVNAAGLSPGSHLAAVSVTSPAAPGNPLLIPVRLTVPQPTQQLNALSFNTQVLMFNTQAGAPRLSRMLSVDSPSGNGQFTIESTATWLTTSIASGRAPAEITVYADPSRVAYGRHNGTLIFRSGGETYRVEVYMEALDQSRLTASVRELTGAGSIGLTSTGRPLTFRAEAVDSPWLSVTPAAGTTPARVDIAVVSNLEPGVHKGMVRITPEFGMGVPLDIPVTVSAALPPAQLNPVSVVGLASGATGPVAPGLLIRLLGVELRRSSEQRAAVADDGRWPVSLGGVSVLFDGRPAPILRIAPDAIDVMVPYEIDGQASTVLQVQNGTVISSGVTVGVIASRPEILPLPEDAASYARHANWRPVTADDPALNGRIVTVVSSGTGLTSPVLDSQTVQDDAMPVLLLHPVEIRFGGRPAEILWTGPMPGQVPGVIQFNVVVPDDSDGTEVTVVTAPEQ